MVKPQLDLQTHKVYKAILFDETIVYNTKMHVWCGNNL